MFILTHLVEQVINYNFKLTKCAAFHYTRRPSKSTGLCCTFWDMWSCDYYDTFESATESPVRRLTRKRWSISIIDRIGPICSLSGVIRLSRKKNSRRLYLNKMRLFCRRTVPVCEQLCAVLKVSIRRVEIRSACRFSCVASSLRQRLSNLWLSCKFYSENRSAVIRLSNSFCTITKNFK